MINAKIVFQSNAWVRIQLPNEPKKDDILQIKADDILSTSRCKNVNGMKQRIEMGKWVVIAAYQMDGEYVIDVRASNPLPANPAGALDFGCS